MRVQGHLMQRTADDCVRCCLASVIGYAYEDVPDFVKVHGPGLWSIEMVEWLQTQNYGCFIFSATSDGELLHQFVRQPEAWIACGPAERGRSHAVVYCGATPTHDPHESGAGLLAVKTAIVVCR